MRVPNSVPQILLKEYLEKFQEVLAELYASFELCPINFIKKYTYKNFGKS